MKHKIILTTIIVFTSLSVMAWGQIGHRVVGKIAENYLSPEAKKAIKAILGNESLAVASTFMDEVKSDDTYDHTHAWHYTTIPNGETYATCEKSEKGEVVKAIEDMKAIITNAESTLEEKQVALRFLVHLVGDIHQPLHVGNGKDRGGNDYNIKWFYSNSNLHRIWDSQLIEHKEYSYSELVEVIDFTAPDQIDLWQSSTTADWANESAMIRERIYPDKGLDKIGYEYAYEHWDLMQEQLLKSGVRLAGVLNTLFQ
jgi:hypothetical protein